MEGFETNPENTTAFRIMGDFQQFLSSQSNITSSERSIEDDTSKASNVMMRVRMKQIEAAHASSEQAHVKANIELESKFEQLTAQNKHLKDKCDMLQGKVTNLTTKLLDMQDEVKQMSKDKEAEISKWENSYLSLQTIKQEADSRVGDEVAMLSDHNQQMSEHNLMLQSQNNMLNLKVEEDCTLMEQYKARLDETQSIMEDYHDTKGKLAESERRVANLKQELDNLQDAKILAKTLREEMNQLRSMEIEFRRLNEENYQLRQNRDNISLLREKLHSSETKLARSESKCANIPVLEVENETLKRKVEELQNNKEANTELEALKSEVHFLRQRLTLGEEEKSTLQSEAFNFKKQIVDLNSNVKDLQKKLTEKNEISVSVNAQLLRLRKRTVLLAKERDSIREILQSYDAELTMTSHTTQLHKRLENVVESSKKLYVRIEELEKENKKIMEESLMNRLRVKRYESGGEPEKQVEDPPVTSQESNAELASMKERILKYEHERTTMIDKIETLQAWIEEGKIKGDYNPDNTKVIHFAMNPADIAHQKSKQEVSNLKEECTRLRQKLKEAAEGHDVSVAEVEPLKAAQEQVNMAELRNKRLKEVFTKKIQEFRQACYSLTGYRIDGSNDSRFKLVSMYAESEEDYLLFQMQDNGEMELLESEYLKSLTELVNLHLHHQNSIPMFLSAVSINLFSQQTMMAE